VQRQWNAWGRRVLHPVGVALLLVGYLLGGPLAQVSAAQDFYGDTGHYLFGQFRDYWNSNGGIDRFGYPITKVFNAKSENGQTYPTQYLQRAVFEEHPENAGTKFEVLGQRLAALQSVDRMKNDPNFAKVAQPNDGRAFFPDTGHTLGGSDPGNAAIRTYWEAAGNGDQQRSILVFGYPISEPFDEMNAPPPAGDGKMHRVQYFERYRLEYHPENSDPKYQVLLGLLGVSQADSNGIAPSDPNRAAEMSGQPQPACIQAAVGGMCPAGSGGFLPRSFAKLHVGDGGDGYGYNVDALSLTDAEQQTLFNRVNESGFGWVRQQVRWSSLEVAPGNFGTDYTLKLDKFINAANAANLNVLLSPVSSPAFAGGQNGGLPAPGDMTRLMSFLGDRYRGKVAAYEIWNEENYAVETGGNVNVAAYPPVLQAGYQALKTRDKNITVVLGGMTPTGTTDPSVALNEVQYLQQLYTQFPDVKKYYDVLGVHPGSNCNPPGNSYPDNPATNDCGTDPDGGRRFTKDDSFYFKRILEMRNMMEQNGESAKKMWLTEFGWDSSPVVVKNYEYSQYNSDAQQAQYLTDSFNQAKGYSWMGIMFVWNLNFQATTADPNNEKYGWGVLNQDGSPRPSFTALKNLPK